MILPRIAVTTTIAVRISSGTVAGPTNTQPPLKAQLKVDDDPDEVEAVLKLSPHVDGPEFDPDERLDMEPTGFPDSKLSIAGVEIQLPNRSLLDPRQHVMRIRYINAAGSRIFLAQFRELYHEFRKSDADRDLLRFVAESGRMYHQFERVISIARLIPFLLGLAIAAFVLFGITSRASEAMFDSYLPGLGLTAVLLLFNVSDPGMISRKNGPWPSAVGTTIATVFASPLVGVAAGFPGFVPDHWVLKWFIFLAGGLSVSHLLISLLEILRWPMSGHRGAWLGRTVVSKETLFYQLVHSAFLIAVSDEIDEVFDWIEDAGDTARALHHGSVQRKLGAADQELMTKRGDKVAATIWHHKYLLAMPGRDEQAVSRSLFNGAMSIYRDDWDNLCHIDPSVSVKSTLRRYAPRVLIAATITAAAFVLPALAALPADQATYIKATLLVAAFFALFATDTASLRDTAMSLTKDAFGKSK